MLAQELRYLMLCGVMLKGGERAVKKGRSSRRQRDERRVEPRVGSVGLTTKVD